MERSGLAAVAADIMESASPYLQSTQEQIQPRKS